MSPKVSVIIPIYNAAPYIERCARSLFEQTLDNIEYIFVNDCTPDESMDILYSVLTEYPHRQQQVKIINQLQNWGVAKARKDGIEAATGQYVIHCDSDDWVDCQMYKMLYEKAVCESLDIVMCDWFRTDGLSISVNTLDINGLDKTCLLGKLIDGSLSGSLWNKLVSRHICTAGGNLSPFQYV